MVSAADLWKDLRDIEASYVTVPYRREGGAGYPHSSVVELFTTKWTAALARYAAWATEELRIDPGVAEVLQGALKSAETVGSAGAPKTAGIFVAAGYHTVADAMMNLVKSRPSDEAFVTPLLAVTWLRDAAWLLSAMERRASAYNWVDLPASMLDGTPVSEADWVDLAVATLWAYELVAVPTRESFDDALPFASCFENAIPGRLALEWLLSGGRLECYRECIQAHLVACRQRTAANPRTIAQILERPSDWPRLILSKDESASLPQADA